MSFFTRKRSEVAEKVFEKIYSQGKATYEKLPAYNTGPFTYRFDKNFPRLRKIEKVYRE